jgi:hypothetical protein
LKYISTKKEVNEKAGTESSSMKSFECEAKDYGNKMRSQSEFEEKRNDVEVTNRYKMSGKGIGILLLIVIILILLKSFHICDIEINIGNIDTKISINENSVG